jgi:hypothetical protein
MQIATFAFSPSRPCGGGAGCWRIYEPGLHFLLNFGLLGCTKSAILKLRSHVDFCYWKANTFAPNADLIQTWLEN